MLFENFFFGAALLAVGINADTTTTEASQTSETETSTSTASDGPQTHEVKVGLAGFKYAPDEIEAKPGDTVRFEFYPPDHSVIRAAFGYPCIPWEYVYADGDPFYSGVQYVNTVAETTTFDILVNDTEPIFYYCGAPDSCLKQGMIGVINPNKTQTLKAQKDAREEFGLALIPGDEWPKEGNPMSTVSGLAATETGAAASATSTAGSDSSNDNHDHDHHSSLNAGQIAGIAIGGAALLVIVGALVYFCGRRGGLEKGYRKSGYVGPNAAQAVPSQVTETPYTTDSPNMSKHVPSGVPSVHYGLGMNHPTSPPMSPGMETGTVNSAHYMAGMVAHHQYQTPPPPAEAPVSAPVELPTSVDPGNSPLPQYSNQAGNTYSWAPREEAGYRPGEKS